MKTELNCAIVRDLLPSYADGLTGAETNELVEAHLIHCPACQAVCERMTQQEATTEVSPHEVDFLKKQRRKTRILALITALAVLLAAAAIWLIPSSFLGTALDAELGINHQLACAAEVENDTLTLTGFLTDGSRFVRAKYQQEGNVWNITLYHSASAPLRTGQFELHRKLPAGVTEIRVMGIPLWQDGVSIHQATGELFDALSSDVQGDGGDAELTSYVQRVLQLDQQLGATGWVESEQSEEGTLSFHIFGSGVSAASDTTAARLLAMKNSALIFAARPAVTHIVWTYDTVQAAADEDGTLGINQEELCWSFSPEDVCDALNLTLASSYSCGTFQQLLDALKLPFTGVYDNTLTDLNFSRLNLYQGTDASIAGLSLRLYVNDKQTYETVLSPADGLAAGSVATIDLPQSGTKRWQESVSITDIGQSADVGDISNAWFTLCVRDTDGTEHRTDPMPVSLLSGRSYRYLLSGNPTEGYTLTAF